MVIAVSGKVARPLFPRRKKSRRRHSAPRQMTQRVHRNMPQITSSARLITESPHPRPSADHPSVRPYHTHTHAYCRLRLIALQTDENNFYYFYVAPSMDGMLSAAFKISLSLLALTFITLCVRAARQKIEAQCIRTAGRNPRRSHLLMTMHSQCIFRARSKSNDFNFLYLSIELFNCKQKNRAHIQSPCFIISNANSRNSPKHYHKA